VSVVPGRHARLPLPELSDYFYVHYAGSAVQHLFAVAAGLDSMVLGEGQILGQLRAAYGAADAASTVA
jgi:glutamyl-tRNA reductase